MLRASVIRLLQHQHSLTVDAVCVDLQQDRDAMPGTAGDPSRRNPGFSHSETAACPGRRATATCGAGSSPAGLRPQGYCGIVQMGPQADAPCLGRGHLLPMNALIEMCGVTKRHEGAGRPAVDGASLTARRTSEGDQMRGSIHPARLTRSRRAHLLGVAVLLSVVLAAGCGGGPGSTATTVPVGSAPSAAASGCLLHPGSCYAPHLFRVAYGIQPLLDKGIDGRGVTVTVLAPAPSPSAPASPPPGSNQPPAATDIRQDLAAFDSMFRLPAARIQVVTTLAGAAAPWAASGEEVGDFEKLHTVAPAATL